MENAGFKAKNRLKIPRGNIHFRKVFLALMLISVMVLSSIEYVSASEPLYYYDKYNVKETYEFVTSGNPYDKEVMYYSSYHGDFSSDTAEGFAVYGYRAGDDGKLISEKSFRNSSIENIPTNSYFQHGARGEVGGSIYRNLGWIKNDQRSYTDYSGDSYESFGVFRVQNIRSEKRKIKGTLVSRNIKGSINQYPTDGIHSDGYWYVRQGLVNNNPTLIITLPTENSYFDKIKS